MSCTFLVITMLTRPNDSDDRGRGLIAMTYPPPPLADGDNNTQTGEFSLSFSFLEFGLYKWELWLMMFFFRGVFFCTCVELLFLLLTSLFLLHNHFSLLLLTDMCIFLSSRYLIHASLHCVLPFSSIFCWLPPSFSSYRFLYHPLSLSPY